MAKNSNSRLGVDIKLDRTRTFTWPVGARSGLEDAFGDWSGMGRGDTRFDAETILAIYLPKMSVLQMAFYLALREDAEKDPVIFTQKISDSLLQDYFTPGKFTKNGGSEEELQEKLIEAYKIAWDPSSLASWKESLRISKRKKSALEKIGQIEMEKNLKENLAETENAEKSLKSLTGEQEAADSQPSS